MKSISMTFKIIYLAVILREINIANAVEKNVCKTFKDYWFWGNGCYYNPDQDDEVPQIVARRGYKVEEHLVETPDGYILTLFRIPGKKTNVLLLHGGTVSSMGFVTNGNASTIYDLAVAGFDVWLPNFRGTRYSNKHRSLTTNDKEYWNFSFHEQGYYDLRTIVNYVHTISGYKEIILIAHSIGSMSALIFCTEFPQECESKVSLIIHLGPTVFMKGSKSLTVKLIGLWTLFGRPFSNKGVFFERSKLQVHILKKVCMNNPITLKTCYILNQLGSGIDIPQYNPETMPIILVQNPDSISTKAVVHFEQVARTDRFGYFDYGLEINNRIYGNYEPPSYNLSNLKVQQHIIYGNNDLMATKENVWRLYNAFPEEVQFGIYVVPYEFFSHDNFLTAKDLKVLLNDHVLRLLQNFSKN